MKIIEQQSNKKRKRKVAKENLHISKCYPKQLMMILQMRAKRFSSRISKIMLMIRSMSKLRSIITLKLTYRHSKK